MPVTRQSEDRRIQHPATSHLHRQPEVDGARTRVRGRSTRTGPSSYSRRQSVGRSRPWSWMDATIGERLAAQRRGVWQASSRRPATVGLFSPTWNPSRRGRGRASSPTFAGVEAVRGRRLRRRCSAVEGVFRGLADRVCNVSNASGCSISDTSRARLQRDRVCGYACRLMVMALVPTNPWRARCAGRCGSTVLERSADRESAVGCDFSLTLGAVRETAPPPGPPAAAHPAR